MGLRIPAATAPFKLASSQAAASGRPSGAPPKAAGSPAREFADFLDPPKHRPRLRTQSRFEAAATSSSSVPPWTSNLAPLMSDATNAPASPVTSRIVSARPLKVQGREAKGMSERSRREMWRWVLSLPFEMLGDHPLWITLTYPGNWKHWVPPGATPPGVRGGLVPGLRGAAGRVLVQGVPAGRGSTAPSPPDERPGVDARRRLPRLPNAHPSRERERPPPREAPTCPSPAC